MTNLDSNLRDILKIIVSDMGDKVSTYISETTHNGNSVIKIKTAYSSYILTYEDKDGENSKFDQELVDAEVIITTPYVTPSLSPFDEMDQLIANALIY